MSSSMPPVASRVIIRVGTCVDVLYMPDQLDNYRVHIDLASEAPLQLAATGMECIRCWLYYGKNQLLASRSAH